MGTVFLMAGSFRIWKDLGKDTSWFKVFPFDQKSDKHSWVIEAYPSLLWRDFLGEKSRKPQALLKYLRAQKFKSSFKSLDQDEADATIMALAARELLSKNKFWIERKLPRVCRDYEGWIMGLEPTKPSASSKVLCALTMRRNKP